MLKKILLKFENNLLNIDKLFAKIWQIICENLTKICKNIDKLFAKIWQIIC